MGKKQIEVRLDDEENEVISISISIGTRIV
jgi:hypothetical protein